MCLSFLVFRILPENVANILSHHKTKEKVLSCSDASDVLRYAFNLTEAALDHEYEVSPFDLIFVLSSLLLSNYFLFDLVYYLLVQ